MRNHNSINIVSDNNDSDISSSPIPLSDDEEFDENTDFDNDKLNFNSNIDNVEDEYFEKTNQYSDDIIKQNLEDDLDDDTILVEEKQEKQDQKYNSILILNDEKVNNIILTWSKSNSIDLIE